MSYILRKLTKVINGQNSGGREALNSRGKGDQEKKPSWVETRSSGTGGSHPGHESWSVSGDDAHIPQSLGTKGNQEVWPSWVHPGVDIFPDLSPRAKPYYGVKNSQGLHFPATTFIGKKDSSSTAQDLMKYLVRYKTII